jgi:hypothetical protein
MTNNKQQKDHVVEANKMVTAVQSIIQKINNVKPSDFCSIETIKQWCEQAKEMEKERSQAYAAFCVKCDREKLPLLEFEDWIKLEESEQ